MVNKETLKMNCKIRKKLNKFDIIKLIFAYIIISITCPLLMKNNNLSPKINVMILTITCGITIMLYFKFYLKKFGECAIYEDPLNFKIFNFPYFNFAVSSWPLTHFLFYLMLAFCFPSEKILIFSIGVSWEIIESLMKRMTKKKGSSNINEKSKRVRINDNTIEYTTYWDSSFKDIIFNSFGMLCGTLLNSYIYN
jgi:hypothetical protein